MKLKKELIKLLQNDSEIIYELSKALDLDTLEEKVDIINKKENGN